MGSTFFCSLDNSQSIHDTRDFTVHFRYRLTSKFRFIKPAVCDLYIPVSVEVFLSASKGLYFNDVSGLTFGFSDDFTDQFSSEFQLSYLFSCNSTEDKFENNTLVYRLRVFSTSMTLTASGTAVSQRDSSRRFHPSSTVETGTRDTSAHP